MRTIKKMLLITYHNCFHKLYQQEEEARVRIILILIKEWGYNNRTEDKMKRLK